MRYIPRNEIEDEDAENEQPVYWEGRPRYVSDQTAFMRWSTELEKKDRLVDDDFLHNNQHRIIDLDKFLPLSFIDDPRSIKLFRLRRMNITLAKDAGLIDLADETTLDNLADYQTTRGVRGNYQKALITQRREWQDKTEVDKQRGILSGLIRGRSNEDRQQNIEEVYHE